MAAATAPAVGVISPPAINQTLRALHAERMARLSPSEVAPQAHFATSNTRQHRYRVGSRTLVIKEKPGLALGAHTWVSSVILSRFMQEELTQELSGKKVIELGAGTGVVGITAALLGARVVLTDQEAVLPLLRANVSANDADAVCTVQEYSWGTQCTTFHPPFDYIVAADVVYRPDLFPQLITSFEMLANADTVIYLGFKERTTQDRDFFRLLGQEFDYRMATRTNHLEHDVVVFRIQKKRRSYLFRSLDSDNPLATAT